MTNKLVILSLALLLFVAPGCDFGGADDDLDEGTFDVTITGAVTLAIRGQAAFGAGRDAQTGNEGFAINLQNSDGQQIVITLLNQPRPGTGSYPVATFGPGVNVNTIPTGQFIVVMNVGSNIYNSEDGSVRLTTSRTDRVAGEVDFTASGLLSAGEITVRGSFDATGRDVVRR